MTTTTTKAPRSTSTTSTTWPTTALRRWSTTPARRTRRGRTRTSPRHLPSTSTWTSRTRTIAAARQRRRRSRRRSRRRRPRARRARRRDARRARRASPARRASARLVRTPHWRPPRHGSASSQPWARSNAPRRRRWPARSVTTPTSTRRSARRSATTCLRGWSACAGVRARIAGHVEDVRGGEAYVLELGRLMDGAERDVVALKEAQKAAYDRLAREERDPTRHCDDFAQRVETWDADTLDPVWAGVLRDASGKRQHAGGVGAYGAPTPKKAEPWSRGASASKKRAVADERPASARLAHSDGRGAFGQSLRVCGVLRGEARDPGRARPVGSRGERAVPRRDARGARPARRAASPPPRRRRRRRRRAASPPPPWRSTTPSSRSTGPRAAGRMSTTRGGAGAWRAATCTTRRRRRWRRTT